MKAVLSSLVLSLLLVSGCHAPLNGTWRLAPGQTAHAVTVASMTLAVDGTFSAHAKYGPRDEVLTGYYRVANDELIFDVDGKSRTYGAKLDGEELVLTHDKAAVRMWRLKPR